MGINHIKAPGRFGAELMSPAGNPFDSVEATNASLLALLTDRVLSAHENPPF